jgi:peptidoglycan/LPS O-acetylase OafA/YrhL
MEIKALTFTRFIAALTIVIFHYGQHCFPFDKGIRLSFSQEGSFAVSYFFCLSGYILAHVYNNKEHAAFNKKQFFIKRIARIYPLYLLSFFATLVLGMVVFNSYPRGFSILLQFIGFHAWIPGICLEINYPAWSIAAEFFFYLCFPFILKKFQNYSNKKIIAITLTIWIISVFIHIVLRKMNYHTIEWGEFYLYNPLLNINAFIFGMAANMMVKRYNGIIQLNGFWITIIFTITLLTLFLIVSTHNIIIPWAHNGLLVPLFVILIVCLHNNKLVISQLLSLKPLQFLGEISFAMYLLQHPIRIVFEQIIQNFNFKFTPSILFYLYLSILILISAIVFLCFEKPVRKIVGRL